MGNLRPSKRKTAKPKTGRVNRKRTRVSFPQTGPRRAKKRK